VCACFNLLQTPKRFTQVKRQESTLCATSAGPIDVRQVACHCCHCLTVTVVHRYASFTRKPLLTVPSFGESAASVEESNAKYHSWSPRLLYSQHPPPRLQRRRNYTKPQIRQMRTCHTLQIDPLQLHQQSRLLTGRGMTPLYVLGTNAVLGFCPSDVLTLCTSEGKVDVYFSHPCHGFGPCVCPGATAWTAEAASPI